MRLSEFIDVTEKVGASVYTRCNIQSSFRRASIHPLNKRRILDGSSIQWQTRNPRHLKTNVELRDVSHRQPKPTRAERLAAAANAISATESDSTAAIALDLLKQTTNHALRLEADVDILRQESVHVGVRARNDPRPSGPHESPPRPYAFYNHAQTSETTGVLHFSLEATSRLPTCS